MTATLKRSIIGFIISAVIFSVGIIFIYNLYSKAEHISTENANLTISNIVPNKDHNAVLQWECANSTVTTYQIFTANEQGVLKFAFSTYATQKSYLVQTNKGGFFTYAVRAYNSYANEYSDFSPLVSILVNPNESVTDISEFIPTLTYENDNGKIRLKWDRPVNCPISSYCLYRKCADGSWEVVTITAPYATAYTDDHSSGEYKLVVRCNQNGELLKSQSSEVVIAEVNDE